MSERTPDSQKAGGIGKIGGFGGGRGGPMANIGRPVEKAKNFRGTLKRLLGYLKPQIVSLTIVVLFAIVATTFTVVGPKITGTAMNQLTNGFISQSIINGIEGVQPKLQDAMVKYEEALATAKATADSTVEQKFAENVAAQKIAAYTTAISQADAIATQQFNAIVMAQKQAAYASAISQADAIATQQFNATVTAQKQAAYAAAKVQAEAAAKLTVDTQFANLYPSIPSSDYATNPIYMTMLSGAYAQADAQAIAGVDANFAAQKPILDAQLAAAKVTAETQAKATVNASFADQKATMDAQLASAKASAETQAKAAVDAEFVKQQASLDEALATAKVSAEATAATAVEDAFLTQMKLTSEQFTVFKSLAALPLIKSTSDYNQRADIAQTFFSDLKLLPTDMISSDSAIKSSSINISNISTIDLTRYVNDIRTTGGSIPYNAIGQILLFLLFIYILSSVFTFMMQYVMSSVAQKVVYTMRRNVDDKLAKLPLSYFDSHSNGEILSRMTNDIDTISSTLQQSMTQLIQAILQLCGYFIMMMTISPLLTLIVMLTLPLYITVTMLIARTSQKFYAAQQKHLGQLSGHTEEMYTGHKVVKAFGHEQDAIATFSSVNDDLYEAGWKAQFLSGIMFPLMNFISNIGYVLISVVGGIFVTKSWLNIGDITAFIQYSRQFTMPIIQTANIANIIQSTVACAERVFEVLDEAEEIPDPANATVITGPQGAIVFDHVRFNYNENQPLIEDMNLAISRGETIAIVGPTGAGKTTLVNLLMRFYEIKGGRITFDGVDVRDMKRGDLRTMFGMVLQDTWLFNGTVEDNIKYGREDATHEEIVNAAVAAHADHFIQSLPNGYNTILNEEASNISQGQKQLLTIARAILADPAVLILDEATSSVDTRTEVLIQKAMGVLMQGRTNFVIAHRLSTIRDAKLILVMNQGAIIEKGTHLELLAQKGFYADLYNSQFAGPAAELQTA